MYNCFGDYMFKTMDNLKLIDIIKGYASVKKLYRNRAHHGFVFKINGESTYNFKNTSISFKENEMLFIPKGTTYEVNRTSSGESEYLLINFDAEIKNASPKKYSFDGYFDIEYLYNNLTKLWLFGETAEKFKCTSIFYNILSYISAIDNASYAYKKSSNIIEPAISFLHDNIFSTTLRVDDLHSLCGISDTYFRKIFKATFGTTPQAYIINKRLSHARSILLNGDYSTIADVSLSVGYQDPFYFSRLFTNRYGVPPSEYHE